MYYTKKNTNKCSHEKKGDFIMNFEVASSIGELLEMSGRRGSFCFLNYVRLVGTGGSNTYFR